MLRTLGAAAAGGVTGLMLMRGTADATTGAMQFGATNNAAASSTILNADLNGVSLSVTNAASTLSATAIRGTTNGGGTGVYGQVNTPTADAYGVYGAANGALGYAVVAGGGQAQMLLAGSVASPVAGAVSHRVGEVVCDLNGVYWACISDGTPGAWRVLAAPASAGSFHAITPSRVYDSRKPSVNPLSTGQNRTVSVADRIDPATGIVVQSGVVPAGATAISYNVTIVGTVGTNGYLAINEGGNAVVTASVINWYGSGQTAANSSQVMVSASRQITVICGGTATSTNFIIDVVGYYR